MQSLSETLVAELAQRDELDFEKETKNTFISLLLTVQNKRRQFTIDRKRGRGHTIVNGEPKVSGSDGWLNSYARPYRHTEKKGHARELI